MIISYKNYGVYVDIDKNLPSMLLTIEVLPVKCKTF